MKKNLLSLQDLCAEEIVQLLDSAERLKQNRFSQATALKGKAVALIFQKPSNRTRVSFEVGIQQMGGYCLYLGPEEISLGKRESTADVAATLSRYIDAIVARTFRHEDIVELGKVATIPIINGLSDLYHPCQALADLLSIKEHFGRFEGLTVAYIGDGNNVCHSLMLGAAKVGLNMQIACPKGYEPEPGIVKIAAAAAKSAGVKLIISVDPVAGVQGADVIYTDVWTSMGQEKEREERLKIFKDFQINNQLARHAAANYIFMHCLPAHRGEEVTADIIDGPHSVVFDQAENRLHVQKAVLLSLLAP